VVGNTRWNGQESQQESQDWNYTLPCFSIDSLTIFIAPTSSLSSRESRLPLSLCPSLATRASSLPRY
jgi:hypothetical protein